LLVLIMTTRKVTAFFTDLSRVCLVGGRRCSCVALVPTLLDPFQTSPIFTLIPVCKVIFARVCQTQVRAFLRDVRCKLQAVSCTRNRIAGPLNSARCGWYTLKCTSPGGTQRLQPHLSLPLAHRDALRPITDVHDHCVSNLVSIISFSTQIFWAHNLNDLSLHFVFLGVSFGVRPYVV
jgi:hypothetical protein